MAPLDAPVAIAAMAYSDIETAHDGTPNDLFLILCFAAFRLYPATAMRAALRQWNGDPFVHAPRDGAARTAGRSGDRVCGLGAAD